MINFKKLIAVSALTMAAVLPAQAGVVLDSFDYTTNGVTPYDMYLVADGAGTVVSTAPDSLYSVSGSSVVYTLENTIDGSAVPNVSTSATFGESQLDYNEGNGVDGKLTIAYTNGVAQDFTLFGDSFYFDILGSDAGINVLITVISASGVSTSTLVIPSAIGSLTTRLLSFDSFVGGADFSALTSLTAFITSSQSTRTDFALGEVGIVPEPSALAILGLGLIGLGLRRRKLV